MRDFRMIIYGALVFFMLIPSWNGGQFLLIVIVKVIVKVNIRVIVSDSNQHFKNLFYACKRPF